MAQASSAAGEPDIRKAGTIFAFTALNQTSSWVRLEGAYWFAAGGDGLGVGSVALEISFDGGTTVYNATMPNGAANSWPVPVCLVATSPVEPQVLHRVKCVAYTSGTINGRLSQ